MKQTIDTRLTTFRGVSIAPTPPVLEPMGLTEGG